MTRAEIRAAIIEAITDVAPEADLGHLDGTSDLRDQLDIDSMDFLNVLVGIDERLGVEIPERDYADVATIDALVAYVESRRAAT